MRAYDFDDKLLFSQATAQGFDVRAIRDMIDDCIDVRQADKVLDMGGADFLATLSSGRILHVDLKTRTDDCSRFWRRNAKGQVIPELALETWSKMPDACGNGAIGWTRDVCKSTDYVLFTFSGYDYVLLLAFQTLRRAFNQNVDAWTNRYLVAPQRTVTRHGSWVSECVFVPAPVVFDAMRAASIGYVPHELVS